MAGQHGEKMHCAAPHVLECCGDAILRRGLLFVTELLDLKMGNNHKSRKLGKTSHSVWVGDGHKRESGEE
jgi:hypothetical protein